MKPQFSLFQKIMTTIFIVLQLAVMASDCIRLMTDDGSGSGTYYYAVNLVLCAGLLAVFLALICNPKICVSSEDTDSTAQLCTLISASRTYMCFIAVDISLIFAFVMFLSKYVEKPAMFIVCGGVIIFIVGAVKYIYDSQKAAEFESISEPETAPEETAEETAPEETAEETAPEETAEETAPEETADETAPEETAEKTAPEETAEETAPEETAEETAPEETAEETAPEETAEETAPEENTEKPSEADTTAVQPQKAGNEGSNNGQRQGGSKKKKKKN